MNSSPSRSHLGTVITLAYLLECLEAGTAQASAHGYRQLVLRLQDALADDIAADALQAIINAYPATGEVFETCTTRAPDCAAPRSRCRCRPSWPPGR